MKHRSTYQDTLDLAFSWNDCYETNSEVSPCTITNANYKRVLTFFNKIIQDDRYQMCRCEQCISDIAALALNYLPPHYYVDPGRGGALGSPMVMIQSAVLEAMEMVEKYPRHEKEDKRRLYAD